MERKNNISRDEKYYSFAHMDRPKRTKQFENEATASAAVGILFWLPKDLIIHLLKTTNLSIGDVVSFCQTGIWTFKLCSEKGVWEDIYNARFGNTALREAVKNVPKRIPIFQDPIYANIRIQLLIEDDQVRIVNIYMSNPLLPARNPNSEYQLARERFISIVSEIFGPPIGDPVRPAIWNTHIDPIFIRMVFYKLLEAGYVPTTANGRLGLEMSNYMTQDLVESEISDGMDFCDVCDKPASLLCSNCSDAIYCSVSCQQADHAEHCEDCIHPSQMDREELMEEIKMHLEHADEHHDAVQMQIGAQLVGAKSLGGTPIEFASDEDLRNWLIAAPFAQAHRKFNRHRVRNQRRRVRRQRRQQRRRGRKARTGTRQAKALGREKGALGRTKARTAVAEGRETLAQRRNL